MILGRGNGWILGTRIGNALAVSGEGGTEIEMWDPCQGRATCDCKGEAQREREGEKMGVVP